MKKLFASYLFVAVLMLFGALGLMSKIALGDQYDSVNNAEFGLSEDFIEQLANYSESFKISSTQTHKERYFELETADFEEENEEELEDREDETIFAQAFVASFPSYSLHYGMGESNYRQQCFNFNALRDTYIINRVLII